jgi:hypothetical protein
MTLRPGGQLPQLRAVAGGADALAAVMKSLPDHLRYRE